MTFCRNFAGTSGFESPESREADDGCDSPLEISASGETGARPKTAAKRKRENRYKNAPPSVLSVSQSSYSQHCASARLHQSRATGTAIRCMRAGMLFPLCDATIIINIEQTIKISSYGFTTAQTNPERLITPCHSAAVPRIALRNAPTASAKISA